MYVCILNELDQSTGLCSARCVAMCHYTPCAPRRLVTSLCRCLHCDCAVPGLFCYCSDVLAPSLYSTHTAAVAAKNNLLIELKNQSGGGLKGGTEKFCHSYRAELTVRRRQQGIILHCLCFFFLSGS